MDFEKLAEGLAAFRKEAKEGKDKKPSWWSTNPISRYSASPEVAAASKVMLGPVGMVAAGLGTGLNRAAYRGRLRHMANKSSAGTGASERELIAKLKANKKGRSDLKDRAGAVYTSPITQGVVGSALGGLGAKALMEGSAKTPGIFRITPAAAEAIKNLSKGKRRAMMGGAALGIGGLLAGRRAIQNVIQARAIKGQIKNKERGGIMYTLNTKGQRKLMKDLGVK